MIKKIVLDTNVLISALFWQGAPNQLLKEVLKGNVENSISAEILKEVEDKLLNKFKLPQEKVREFLEVVIFNSQLIDPEHDLDIIEKDPSDNKIIECAVEANASFIVSGDKHLLEIEKYQGIKIISPNKFLAL